MFNKSISVVAFCLAMVFLVGHVQAERINTAGWKGGSYKSKKTGRFSHCVVSAKYKRGDRLLFSINRKYVFSLGIADNRWNLKRGSKYSVSLQVDRKQVFDRRAVAVSRQQLVIPVNNKDTFFRMVRGGRKLWVKANGLNRGYSLRGTRRALNAILRCVKRQLRYERDYYDEPRGGVDQPRSTDEPVDEPVSSDNRRIKTRKYASLPPSNSQRNNRPIRKRKSAVSNEQALIFSINLLSETGISGYKILEKSPLKKSGYQAVWRYSKGKLGALSTIRNSRKDFVDVQTAKILSSDAKSCKGKFASGFRKSDTTQDWSGRRLFTVCSNSSNGRDFTIHYSIGKQPNGMATLVATMVKTSLLDNPESDDSEEIDQAIYQSKAFRSFGRN